MSNQSDTIILFKNLPKEEIQKFEEAKNTEPRYIDHIGNVFIKPTPNKEWFDDSGLCKKEFRLLFMEWKNEHRSCDWTKWGYEIENPEKYSFQRQTFNYAISAQCEAAPIKELHSYCEYILDTYYKGKEEYIKPFEILLIDWYEEHYSKESLTSYNYYVSSDTFITPVLRIE